jgi:hypothetical protein
MVDLETAAHRAGGVTLVECRLESDVPRRVRVVNRLAGPVWPPRRRGVPAAGWDGNGVRVTVEGRAGVGYATPAPPADPPATITAVEEPEGAGDRTDDANAFDDAVEVTATRAGVVRDLSDPRPPRDAIPGTHPGEASSRQSAKVELAGGRIRKSDPAGEERQPDRAGREASRDHGGRGAAASAPNGAVTPADEWLSAVERRIELLECVGAATTLPDATTAVDAVGGLEAVESLAATVAADADRLARIARRAESLAGRASTVEPDLETLRQLA